MNVEMVRKAYRNALAVEVGESIDIRRYSGSGLGRTYVDTPVMARVTGYSPEELVGTIQQGDRNIVVLVEDLVNGGFVLPVTANDKVVLRGRELAIMSVDDSTRRVAGMLIALELQARG